MANITPTTTGQPNDRMEHGGNYAFYDYSDHQTDEPLMYANLLASATSKIEIWDPYFNDSADEYQLFLNIQHSVELILLTHGTPQNSKMQKVVQHLKNHIQSGISVQIKLYYTNDDASNGKYNLHDRFLIIDDYRYFLVGGSWGYHSPMQPQPTTGKQVKRGSTGIYEIVNDDDAKQLIRQKFDKFLQSDKTLNIFDNT